jgi:hypothetical protein
MNVNSRPALSPVAVWLVVCVLLNVAGWVLSALGQLNRAGYAVVFVLAGAAACGWWLWRRPRLEPGFRWSRLRRRYRRGLPLGFAVLAGLAILGGVLHGPSNYDGLAYRIPRVLHWLAEGQWHWIQTEFQRVNTRACGFEWLMAPLFVFSKTDRLVFLLNAVTFLLLPGMCYGVLHRLGVRRRVAAAWMWLLPTGYCFLLQAGSISNDLFGAACALAALYYALRGREQPGIGNASMAVLAAALMTGAKTSNLPLLLPCLLAGIPAWSAFLRRPAIAAAVLVAAVSCSFLPMAVMNLRHSGDWSGLRAESVNFNAGSPAVCLANNSVLLVIQNFVPPVFPLAKQWEGAAARLIPESFGRKIQTAFEPSGAHWRLGEMQVEESAGLGFGISLLLLLSFVAAQIHRSGNGLNPGLQLWRLTIYAGALVALAVFMAKSGLSTAARLIAPYYLFLIPLLLQSPAHAWIIRARWWRVGAGVVMLLGALLLVISPARPLWPARTVLARWDAAQSHPVLARARIVYEVYGARSDGFAPARALLPPDLAVLGLVSYDDPETSLWRPFGSRRIRHVTHRDTPATLAADGVGYVLVRQDKLELCFQRDFNVWLRAVNGRVERTVDLNLRAGSKPTVWHLVRLAPLPQ